MRSPWGSTRRGRWSRTPAATAWSGGAAGAGVAVRLGLSSVRTIGDELAERIAAGRPYAFMADLVHRIGLSEAQVEALATAGAFGCFGLERREALWAAGAVAQARADRLPGAVVGAEAPQLPGMSPVELSAADLWATWLSTFSHPVEFLRERLDTLGAVSSDGAGEGGRELGVGHRVGSGGVERAADCARRHGMTVDADDVVEGHPAPPLAARPEPAAEPDPEQRQQPGQHPGARRLHETGAHVDGADAGGPRGIGRALPLAAHVGQEPTAAGTGLGEHLVPAIAVEVDPRGGHQHPRAIGQAGHGLGQQPGALRAAGEDLPLDLRRPAQRGDAPSSQ